MNLKEIRDNIDLLDSRIHYLLNERMEWVLMAKKFKSRIEDKKREDEVFEKIKRHTAGLISGPFMERIFREIIRQSKSLQEQDCRLIAFQGEHGAYGEVASRAWDKNLVPAPCRTFHALIEGVESGLYDIGILPVENNLAGVVDPVNELLIETDLHVVGAVALAIHHCLLTLPGTEKKDIRTVYSHPQALRQCRRFLEKNHLEPVPYSDTAGAAKMLTEMRSRGSAAIASRLCAILYDLEIKKENIEDHERNRTRFLVLSKEKVKEEGDKCSIIFSTEDKEGALFKVLGIFAREHINLTRIDSIPYNSGNYAFFLDFIGSTREERVMRAIEDVKEAVNTFRLMGCYKEKNIL